MAPKNKFTREEFVEAALEVVRRQGTGALTAKAVAEKLGVSTRPVFTCFGTMETLREEVRSAAQRLFDSYVTEVSQDTWILFPWDQEAVMAKTIIELKGDAK